MLSILSNDKGRIKLHEQGEKYISAISKLKDY